MLDDPYDRYVAHMSEIRLLSSPALGLLDDVDAYSKRLADNFKRIGQLAAANREILTDALIPLVESREPLSDRAVEQLSELSEKLFTVGGRQDFENLDLPMMSIICDRLRRDALERDDLELLFSQLTLEMFAAYGLMNLTTRLKVDQSLCETYRERGLAAGKVFLHWCDKSRFLDIPSQDSRDLALTNARYAAVFYESTRNDGKANEECLALLEHMLDLADDPFYHEAVPDFDWDYFRYRTHEYIQQATEIGNCRGYTLDLIERIADHANGFEELVARDPTTFEGILGHELNPLRRMRNRFLAGRVGRSTYLQALTDFYRARNPRDFSTTGGYENVLVPLEIICLFERGRLSEPEKVFVTEIYESLSSYIFGMPNTGALSVAMEYYSEILFRFIEVPGGVTFERFGLESLAALHPPTYVHSRMVGHLSECLVGHLIGHAPEHLVGALGCADATEVVRRREELESYTYHAALCHDLGKISIIDTVFMYGRNLTNTEFQIIRLHPMMGSILLSAHPSTQHFADVAAGHHTFYDGSAGYPSTYERARCHEAAIVNLVTCADCIDAATDTIGRSYGRGKNLDEVLNEIKLGAGVRYAPYLVDLLEDEETLKDIAYLLDTGRERIYRDTYRLLRDMQRQERTSESS